LAIAKNAQHFPLFIGGVSDETFLNSSVFQKVAWWAIIWWKINSSHLYLFGHDFDRQKPKDRQICHNNYRNLQSVAL